MQYHTIVFFTNKEIPKQLWGEMFAYLSMMSSVSWKRSEAAKEEVSSLKATKKKPVYSRWTVS